MNPSCLPTDNFSKTPRPGAVCFRRPTPTSNLTMTSFFRNGSSGSESALIAEPFEPTHVAGYGLWKRHLTRKLFALATLAILLLAPGAPAAIPPAEQLLPGDTLLIFSAPDWGQLRTAYQKSAPTQLWNDPAMKPFRGKFIAKWTEEFVQPLERDLGVKFDDYSAFLQGQLTFAVTQGAWQGAEKNDGGPAFLLLLDARDKADLLKTNLADLRKKWSDAGKPIRTEKIRDVDFFVVPLTTNDTPKTLLQFFPHRQPVEELGKAAAPPSAQAELIIGQHQSLLLVGSSITALEKVMARLTGGTAPALAEDAGFAANQLAVFRDAPLFGWFNARLVFDLVRRGPEEKPNPAAPNPLPLPPLSKILSATGLQGLKSAALAFRNLGGGSQVEFFLGAPEAGREGLLKLLALDVKDSNPPAFVPADVVKFQRARVNFSKTITTLEKMLNDFSPQALNTWNFILSNGNEAAKLDDSDYDLRKHLFGNLGDDLITYEKAPRADTAGDGAPSLYLIGSPDAEKLASALRGLLVILSPDGRTPAIREFLGKKIMSVKLTALPIGAGAGPRTLSYAASGGYVAFSTDVALLEEYLRSAETPPKSLREVPGLAEAAQKVGGQNTGWFGYENQNETTRQLFTTLKLGSGETNRPSTNPLTTAMPFAGPQKSFQEWMDFSLLPSFDQVAKYFSFSVYSGSANMDGIRFNYFSPAPAELISK